MIQVSIDSVRQKLIEAGKIRGLSNEEASSVAEEYIDAELSGFKTHGVGKFFVINDAIQGRRGTPRVTTESTVMALVDGQRELGSLAARYCINLLIPKARKNGMGLVALRNASRYGRLTPYGKLIAESGLVGIVTNSGGPAAVAPYGSYAPILGTNPICIAFPRGDTGPLVFDFATSDAVWGEIRQAMIESRDLPLEAFYKSDGTYAVDPKEANAVRAFDGAKGYALCLAVEILCGAFVGARMGLSVQDEYDLGFLFLAFDPTMFRDSVQDFYSEIATLAEEIHKAPAIQPGDRVWLPGERSMETRQLRQRRGALDLDDSVWDMLCRMSTDPSAGLEATNLTD